MYNKLDPLVHIGEEYGIYTITDVTNERRKDRHLIYKGVCKECGYERFSGLNSFKNSNVQTCNHKNLLNDDKINVWYLKNKKQCLFCGNDISLGDLSFNEYKERKFCNNSCAASYNHKLNKINNKKKKYCKYCGNEIKSTNLYCSTRCQHEYQYQENIKKWKNGEINGTIKDGAAEYVKRYIKEKYNNQCCKCGWHEVNKYTGKVPLEVHHKDGDYKNNEEDNLELLCPNCHALTPTYKSLNNGNGRKDRYK